MVLLKTFAQSRFIEYAALAVAFAISMSLRALIPAHVMPGTVNDDLLGVWLANNIIHGEWLGSWNIDTFAKPSGYPIFLAACNFLNLNPVIVLHLIYLLLSLIFTYVALNLSGGQLRKKSTLFVIGSFSFLAFNPAMLANEFSRIYRTSLFTVLVYAFTLLITFILKYLYQQLQSANNFFSKKTFKLLVFSVAAGMVYGLMTITRSDSVWILIGPILGAALLFFNNKNKNLSSKSKINLYHASAAIVSTLVVFYLAAAIPQELVRAKNYQYYGIGITEDFYTGEFAQAWRGLTRIQISGNGPDFIAVSKKQREIAYSISPSFATLKPILDGAPNTGWKVYSCLETKICDDSGGWFPWELRTAASITHKIDSAPKFQAFFGQVALDIEAACKERKILCGRSSISTGSKPILEYNKMELIKNSFRVPPSLLNLEQSENISLPSSFTKPRERDLWLSVLNLKTSNFQDTTNGRIARGILNALHDVYRVICPIFFVLALISFGYFRKSSALWLANFGSVLTSLLLYTIVIGLLQSSVGFRVDLALYALPIQPLFMISLLFGVLQFGNLASKHHFRNRNSKR